MQGRDVRSDRMTRKDVSVVLAQGAWADGSGWTRVITALRAEAVNVFAAPLAPYSATDGLSPLSPG
jgi:hypothetical protein